MKQREKELSEKPLNELPNYVKDTLYLYKLKGCNIQYDDFINWYHFILVDNIVYHSDDIFSNLRLKEYAQASDTLRKLALPDAVIYGDKIVKNRYGNIS